MLPIVTCFNFYFNIIIEDTIRTSSYRYTYARTALVTICNNIKDFDTLNNLSTFHKLKVQFEINNPVKKDVAVSPNRATIQERRSITPVAKKAAQMPMK